MNFVISNLEFNSLAKYSTPSHLATSQATVQFDFSITAKAETLTCKAQTVSTYPNYFDGTEWYDCDDTDDLSAQFKYDYTTGEVKVKANWQCPK